jgi:lipid-binding SYLF domain-containing protein
MKRNIAVTLLAVSAIASAAEPGPSEAHQRLTAASEVFSQIMAAPDKGIPEWVLERAHCAAIVPAVKQGAFIVGAKYGKGVLVCRREGGGWSAPSTVRIEGGSFGFQIGGGEVDAVLMVMNEEGKHKLLKSEFTLGAEAGAMAGPVGRSTKAETDALMPRSCHTRGREAYLRASLFKAVRCAPITMTTSSYTAARSRPKRSSTAVSPRRARLGN